MRQSKKGNQAFAMLTMIIYIMIADRF